MTRAVSEIAISIHSAPVWTASLTAHPTLVGENQKEIKDAAGKAFGKEIHEVAEEGKFKKVSYLWPRPGSKKPVRKISFVTKVGDQICGVGYYKQ
jgi:signal transduction histidine kinase